MTGRSQSDSCRSRFPTSPFLLTGPPLSPSCGSLTTHGCQRWGERGQAPGGGACLLGPALSPGSRAGQHSGRSPRAALLWELSEKPMVRRAGARARDGAGAEQGVRVALGWEGCWKVCEIAGVLEEGGGKVLDPSLTPPVTLDVLSPMSPLSSVSPMVKCTEQAYVLNGHCVLAGEGHVRGRWPQKRTAAGGAPGRPRPPPSLPSPWKGLLLVWMRWLMACSRSRFFTHWIPRF